MVGDLWNNAEVFARQLVKLEQRILLYPSKKRSYIDHIGYERSDVKTKKQLTAWGSTFSSRSGIEIYVSFNNNR